MKKKVLFLIHTLQVGGAEKVLVNLVNNMDYDKYDITVMTVVDTGAFRQELNKNIKYDSIIKLRFINRFKLKKEKKGKNNVGKSGNLFSKKSLLKSLLASLYKFFWRNVNVSWVYKKCVKKDYDVEIAFLEGISAKIISSSNNKKSKKIAWIHVDMINETKTEKFFKNYDTEKACYDKFNQIVCVSEVARKQFIKKYQYDESKIIVKYNPINQEEIIKKSKEKIDTKNTNFTFCTIGRLSSQKGYDRLINVVAKLNNNGYKFDLWIIGVGAEEGNLKNKLKELNIKNVYFLGYKKNPYPYIRVANAFVCSSRAEGFSTVVSEAIILGKAIVTTNCSGMKELLGNNSEYGLICDNNEEALYFGMEKFIKKKRIVEKYEQKVVERKKIFSLKKSVEAIEKILE